MNQSFGLPIYHVFIPTYSSFTLLPVDEVIPNNASGVIRKILSVIDVVFVFVIRFHHLEVFLTAVVVTITSSSSNIIIVVVVGVLVVIIDIDRNAVSIDTFAILPRK